MYNRRGWINRIVANQVHACLTNIQIWFFSKTELCTKKAFFLQFLLFTYKKLSSFRLYDFRNTAFMYVHIFFFQSEYQNASVYTEFLFKIYTFLYFLYFERRFMPLISRKARKIIRLMMRLSCKEKLCKDTNFLVSLTWRIINGKWILWSLFEFSF